MSNYYTYVQLIYLFRGVLKHGSYKNAVIQTNRNLLSQCEAMSIHATKRALHGQRTRMHTTKRSTKARIDATHASRARRPTMFAAHDCTNRGRPRHVGIEQPRMCTGAYTCIVPCRHGGNCEAEAVECAGAAAMPAPLHVSMCTETCPERSRNRKEPNLLAATMTLARRDTPPCRRVARIIRTTPKLAPKSHAGNHTSIGHMC
jgi:hypothetical protein